MSRHPNARGVVALQCVQRGGADQLAPAVLVDLVAYGWVHRIAPGPGSRRGRWVLTRAGLAELAAATARP